MNIIKYTSCLVLLSIVLFQSCTIEKRHYTNGYCLQWKKSADKLTPNTKTNLTEEKKVSKTIPSSEKNNDANSLFNSLTASADKLKGAVLFTVDSLGCDTLIMRNGTVIKVKVTEVSPTEIKYKYCNNLEGPSYVIYRYQASYIKYRNGTFDSFSNEYPPAASPVKRNNGNYSPNNRDNFSGNSRYSPTDKFETERYVANKSTRSLVLGILSFLLSFLGIITAIFAIIRGTECLRLIKEDPYNLWRYRSRAVTGIVLGAIFLGLILMLIIYLMAILSII